MGPIFHAFFHFCAFMNLEIPNCVLILAVNEINVVDPLIMIANFPSFVQKSDDLSFYRKLNNYRNWADLLFFVSKNFYVGPSKESVWTSAKK
jgi:hypothetical protein